MSHRGESSRIEALRQPPPAAPDGGQAREPEPEAPEGHDPAEGGARGGGLVARLKRLAPRGLRQKVIPPLGHLRAQYEPRELRVPRSYTRDRAPEDAPRISVVVPSLNYAQYLSATLASILEQDYPELELIVCDGGSEDGTLEILRREQERLAEVHAGPDAGQAEAINRGLDDSSGEILAWVNADDLLLPGTLARVGRYFAEHPEVDMVYGNRVLIDEQGRDVGVWVTPAHSDDSLQWFDFIPQETAFWRRSIWETVGGIDCGFEYGFDWELFLRFQRAGARIERLPRFLGAFRQHEGQKTRVYQEQALAELEAIRQDFHGRPVGLAEAQARAERVLVKAGPHHLLRRTAWRRAPSVPVDAGPGGASEPDTDESAVAAELGPGEAHLAAEREATAAEGTNGNASGAQGARHEEEGSESAAPRRN